MLTEASAGFNPMGLHTFSMSFGAASTRTTGPLKPGGYTLRATKDCWVRLGDSSVVASPAAVTTTQPASPNNTIKLFADVEYPLTIPAGSYLAVVRDASDGVLLITGPWQMQP
jgi:hypothetical protein